MGFAIPLAAKSLPVLKAILFSNLGRNDHWLYLHYLVLEESFRSFLFPLWWLPVDLWPQKIDKSLGLNPSHFGDCTKRILLETRVCWDRQKRNENMVAKIKSALWIFLVSELTLQKTESMHRGQTWVNEKKRKEKIKKLWRTDTWNNLWITDALRKTSSLINQKYKKTFQFWKKIPDTGDWEGSTEISNLPRHLSSWQMFLNVKDKDIILQAYKQKKWVIFQRN